MATGVALRHFMLGCEGKYCLMYCLFLAIACMDPYLIYAQQYEEQLRFLRQKLVELEQIELTAIQAQRQLTESGKAHATSSRDQWQHLERQSRQTIEQVDVIIKELESYFFQNVIKKYSGEDSGIKPIDTSTVLTRLDGRRESIRSYRGQVVLLHFWATWCKPCLHELPSLKTFYDQYDSEDFEILAISLDARRKDVDRFLADKGVRFPVYLDPGRSIYRRIVGGLEVLPRSILLDKKGKVFKSYAGNIFQDMQRLPLFLEDVGGLLSAN